MLLIAVLRSRADSLNIFPSVDSHVPLALALGQSGLRQHVQQNRVVHAQDAKQRQGGPRAGASDAFLLANDIARHCRGEVY